MKKVKVKNITDDLVVERLGYYFQPGEEKTIEIVHSNHMMVLAACRNLEVEEIKVTVEPDNFVDISQMNMDEVIDGVAKGEIHLEKTIQSEEQGKRRSKLLKKLHDMKG